MNRKLKTNLIIILIAGLLVVWVGHLVVTKTHPTSVQKTQALYQTSSRQSATQHSQVTSSSASSPQPQTVNWHQPSQSQPYPDLTKYPAVYFDVNIAAQRVYVRDGANHDQVLYTMYCTTGKNNGTPRGTYHIQAERGLHFYNDSEQEGANYYVSWLNHGEYLFHTVPVDQNGHYITNIANQIGHHPISHGCVQLTIPDAQWVYEHVPYGMKVVVE